MPHSVDMTQTSISDTSPAARAIGRLNAQLLALAEREDDIPAAEIERTAKAIAALIRSVEQAEGFLAERGAVERPGDRLSPDAERALHAKLKTALERGLLDGAAP